ncbi:hypothetical protein AX15_004996 [Amanita polypyramis BW_CC]|nr:hypothetical protein AX15_004996 [Amanita polypyramis BW_CC]
MVSSQHVVVANLTQDTLACYLRYKKARRLPRRDEASALVLDPLVSKTVTLPGTAVRLALNRKDVEAHFDVRLHSKTWRVIQTSFSVPWRIYVLKVASNDLKVVIVPKRDMSTFLSTIPDDIPLSAVLLPGTHDSMSFYGWPISQCQSLSTPLMVQLCSGIRFLDIRLAVVAGRLISYHGIYPQRASFQVILATIFAFLSGASTCHETIVVSIKQEDFQRTPPQEFSLIVRDEIINGPGGVDVWFLENRMPRLGEVRGKAIMFSRFGGNGYGWEGGLEGLGIHPQRWPDSEKYGFTWDCKGTLVRTHDWYNITSFLSVPEKVTLATQNLNVMLDADQPTPRFPILPITYFSAASFPLALPTVIARGFGWPQWGLGIEGVNSRLGKWLLEQLCEQAKDGTLADNKLSRDKMSIRGWTFLDFYAEPESRAVIPLLIECNFACMGGIT